ncbi:MAG: hypothetical protein K8S25_07765 [Alphaproteobacteria bacterium]|nr:hypothetical protein [Alphaproteobacteria bacterium]
METPDRSKKVKLTVLLVCGWFVGTIAVGLLRLRFTNAFMLEPTFMSVSAAVIGWFVLKIWSQGATDTLRQKFANTYLAILGWGAFCLVWFYVSVMEFLPLWATAVSLPVAFLYLLARLSSIWRRVT